MTTAALIMSYGTPRDLDDVEVFYTDVRHGHPPTKEQLAELVSRYVAIGGSSPLAERTNAQVHAIGQALERLAPGRFLTVGATKHASPNIDEAVSSVAERGAGRLIGLVLAPHYSPLSVGDYVERATRAAKNHGMDAAFVLHWHDDPILVELLAERVTDALRGLELDEENVEIVFTAHSLPRRTLDAGDHYPEELAVTASLVASRLGTTRFRIGWQSAGRTGEEWIGPDISDILATLSREGRSGVVVCPAGFTSDHLEVLYDLDIVARRRAEELGLRFCRTASLNDDRRLAKALAQRIQAIEVDRPSTGLA